MELIKTKHYPIEIGSIAESSLADLLSTRYENSKVVILVDENTHDYCLEYLITTFESLQDAEVMLLPAGEENKVLEICFQVWEALSEYGVGRKDLIINLGGGVVTDMGGFIASVFKRGLDFIHVPTTLLAMVDASVGGKTGVDLGPYKNQLGVFANPKAIYMDLGFLETLESKELVNGFAEMVKHALIGDAKQWKNFFSTEDLGDLITVEQIKRSVSFKNDIVEQDPHEAGIRKILNFGHTAGHALEGYFLDKAPIDHGHAVALGIVVESYISMRRGWLGNEDFQQIQKLILDWFPLVDLQNQHIPDVIELLKNDKKNHSGKIQCAIIKTIGSCEYDVAVSTDEFLEAFVYLSNLNINLN